MTCDSDSYGFTIDGIYCIAIVKNNYRNKQILKTYESGHGIFKGKNNILSEDGGYNGIDFKEIEVFQIIF